MEAGSVTPVQNVCTGLKFQRKEEDGKKQGNYLNEPHVRPPQAVFSRKWVESRRSTG
jgi:hypothetical protein